MQHYNPSISEDFTRIFNTKSGENTNEVSEEIVSIIPIERRIDIATHGVRTASGTLTVYTTPSDKDFYLTNITFSLAKDVTCDVATGRSGVTAFIDGVNKELLSIAFITLTANLETVSIQFNKPFKIDRNTAIANGTTYTAGAMSRVVNIQGYTVETIKGV